MELLIKALMFRQDYRINRMFLPLPSGARSRKAGPKFDVKLPFRRAQVEPVYSVDAYLCRLLKETPMVLPVLFSKG
jgi:hypothetical protein